jgi:hypothetical protein
MWNGTKKLSRWMMLLLPSSVVTAAAVTSRKAQGSTAPDNVSSRLMITVSNNKLLYLGENVILWNDVSPLRSLLSLEK